MDEHVPRAAPAFFDEDMIFDKDGLKTWRFHRTEIESAEQLLNGRAWIQVFEHALQAMPKVKPRRQLGLSMTDPSDPRHTMPTFDTKRRNDALKAMRDTSALPDIPDAARRGIGKTVRLPTGDEVLLICNVGPDAPPRLEVDGAPAKFRDMPIDRLPILAVASKCPHQQGCLADGELKDVEDIAGDGRRAIVRCAWHNMQFDLSTGQGEGNYYALQRYPVKVVQGTVYVGVAVEGLRATEAPFAGEMTSVAELRSATVDCGGANVNSGGTPIEAGEALPSMEVAPVLGAVPPPSSEVPDVEMESPPRGQPAAFHDLRSRSPRLLRHASC